MKLSELTPEDREDLKDLAWDAFQAMCKHVATTKGANDATLTAFGNEYLQDRIYGLSQQARDFCTVGFLRMMIIESAEKYTEFLKNKTNQQPR